LVLLAGAGLMLRSLAARLTTYFGFETRRIITLRAQPTSRDRVARQTFYNDLKRRAAALASVEMAAVSDGIPAYGPDWGTSLHVEGSGGKVDTGMYQVSPEYFRLFRIPLVAGRLFEERDGASSPLVVVISERAARQFFPGENPLGRRMDYPSRNESEAVVIGVVGDVKYLPPEAKDRAVVYCSNLQSPAGGFLAVRAAGDPRAVVAALRDEVRALDPEAPVYDVRTMKQQVAAVTWRSRFGAVLLGLFAMLAVLLAALGIYGVFSYSVAARTRDIGVRIALGARRGAILRMFLREGALLCAIALAVGLPAAFALSRVFSSLLYRVTATDPLTFASATALLAAVALLACYLPARRATKVDPMEALRHE
jgi:predicted permease